MKKVITFLFLFVFLSLCVVSLVSADSVLIASFDGVNPDYGSLVDVHPSDSGRSAVDKTWAVVTNSYVVSEIEFNLKKFGSPNAVLRGYIADSDHDFVELSTNTISASSLTTSGALYNFTFDGTYTAIKDSTVYVGFYVQSAVLIDASNYVMPLRFEVSQQAQNGYLYNMSSWQVSWGIDCYIYGEVAPEPTATPSPSPSPSPVPTEKRETVLTTVPSYYMIVLVLFGVVAVLAGIYVGFEREQSNKGVAFLFALVAVVIFVVLIVGYLTG